MSGAPSGTAAPMNPAEFAHIAAVERDFWWYQGMRKIMFRLLDQHLGRRPIGRALEAGCGTGYLAALMQKESHSALVPMDISPEGLTYARGMGAERLVCGDVTRMPFATGVFDLVLSMDVLAHLPRGAERAAAAEMARVLTPGGVVVVRTSALEILRSRHSEFVYERQRFTRRRIREVFSAAGFLTLRCTYANTFLMPAALAKFRLWEPLARRPVQSGVDAVAPWMNRLLYGVLALEAALIGAGLNLPAGQSVFLVGARTE